MSVNGISSNPAVTGKVIPNDGCKGGEFQIISATFAQPIVVSWQAVTSAFSGFKTIDLANPPSGWSVRVSAGCGSELGCTDPADSYNSGLTGSLTLAIGKRAMYDMSVCVHVEESASSPHPVVHSLDLFATHIEAN